MKPYVAAAFIKPESCVAEGCQAKPAGPTFLDVAQAVVDANRLDQEAGMIQAEAHALHGRARELDDIALRTAEDARLLRRKVSAALFPDRPGNYCDFLGPIR